MVTSTPKFETSEQLLQRLVRERLVAREEPKRRRLTRVSIIPQLTPARPSATSSTTSIMQKVY